ncbi:TRAP transporter substrate-binding protein [Parasedimentitalea maritima]|uniref:Transporter n=1 Tax=Parasedimentitalea maritima TaxID=2578117 RepID=A0A5R8Z2A7_9RHOB|nr:TRAP transporter substrate-binding protein [Zongyanglinia marina]KAE9628150.1 transporter [Zongyanglinia marina]TLP59445.1 TRAP transporter substrate-binding protein [Zongyanglinia marina]
MKRFATAAGALALMAGTAFADSPVLLKAVGTWSSLTNYQKHEGPFFNERLAEASGGQIVGEIQSQSGLGLKGFEIMRLVKNGVFDFAFGLPGYVAAENAIFEGADLSSVTQDIETQRQVAEAYYPTMEKAFAETYNAKLLMLYPFPSQTLWCNAEVNGIEDLKGKKIRVYATTLGDFVEGVGGTSVTVSFSEVIPALEKGVVDCGITGTMSAYTANWQQVATHAYTLRVGWGLAFGAMNMDKWNSMSAEQQALMQTEISALNDRMWAETATEDAVAISCITGGDCEIGEKGAMKLVEPSSTDLAIRDTVATDVVLARWAERCGADCAENWNNTVGKVLGMTAAAN